MTKKGLQGWLKIVEDEQPAALSALLRELNEITASDETSANQLADAILKDPNLTSQVIRKANSVYYNLNSVEVTTVSRAILNIGFSTIRSLVLSIKVLESVLKENSSDLMLSMLARTLHAATQAKNLLPESSSEEREEVFVATLMMHLSELMVLNARELESKTLTRELNDTMEKDSKDAIAERVLGVSFTRLSKSLMGQWHIGGLVNDVLNGTNTESPLVQAVHLGDEISRVAKFGWNSPEYKALSKQIAEFTGEKVSDVEKRIAESADEAASVASHYGKGVLNGQIPSSKETQATISKQAEAPEVELIQPDQSLQLNIMQELTSMLMGKFNINSVFQTILEGLNRGVGLERVALCIFDKSHQSLVAKYALGEGAKDWRKTFIIKYEKNRSGFVYNLFEQEETVWIGGEVKSDIADYVGSEFKMITGANEFLIAPLVTSGKKVGFIYGDLGCSKRPMDKSYFDGFGHFVQQAKLALTVLASK